MRKLCHKTLHSMLYVLFQCKIVLSDGLHLCIEHLLYVYRFMQTCEVDVHRDKHESAYTVY